MPKKTIGNLIFALTVHDKKVMLVALILLTLSGLLEGISIITLLPVITLTMESSANTAMTGINQYITQILETIGLAPELITLLSIIVIGIVLKSVLLFVAQNMISFSAVNYAAEKRLTLTDALMACRWPYFVQKSTGEISSALTTESNQLAALYMAVISFYALAVQVVVYAVIAALISWEMLLGAVFVGGFIIVILKGVVMHSRKAGQIQVDAMKGLNDRLIDGLRILKPLKAMAREHQITPFLTGNIDQLKTSNHKLIVLTNLVRISQEPIMTFFLAIGIFLMMSYAGVNMATLLFSVLIYHRMVTRIGITQSSLQKIIAQQDVYWSVADIISETQAAAEVEKDIKRNKKATFKDNIQLQNLCFSYGDNIILDSLSLTIPAHKFVSFVGPSGAGKTTLLELVIGLNKPKTGQILIDGTDLQNLELKSWRYQIGFVPQEIALSNDTVLNNVTLYDDSISEKEVIAALRQAEAWDFIKDLPQGLETITGEQGARFSGGQRQRLSIARALVHKPTLLILDEPTTALDPDTEHEICMTLKEIAKNTTIIAISHQKKIAESSDVVFYMKDGKIEKIDEK